MPDKLFCASSFSLVKAGYSTSGRKVFIFSRVVSIRFGSGQSGLVGVEGFLVPIDQVQSPVPSPTRPGLTMEV